MPSENTIEIASKEELVDLLSENPTMNIIIDFYATWCGPCRLLGPIFENLAEKHAGKIIAIKVDVEEGEDLSNEMGISTMPTFLVLDSKGNKIDEMVGSSKDKLAALFTKYSC